MSDWPETAIHRPVAGLRQTSPERSSTRSPSRTRRSPWRSTTSTGCSAGGGYAGDRDYSLIRL